MQLYPFQSTMTMIQLIRIVFLLPSWVGVSIRLYPVMKLWIMDYVSSIPLPNIFSSIVYLFECEPWFCINHSFVLKDQRLGREQRLGSLQMVRGLASSTFCGFGRGKNCTIRLIRLRIHARLSALTSSFHAFRFSFNSIQYVFWKTTTLRQSS